MAADSFRSVEVTRVRGTVRQRSVDFVAAEEPLEIRLHGRCFAVIARTPGDDHELVAGLLFSEHMLTSAEELRAIDYCVDQQGNQSTNIVDVTLVEGSPAMIERKLTQRSSWSALAAVSDLWTKEFLRTARPSLRVSLAIGRLVLSALPARLRAAQRTFDSTGGLHAAGLFTADGELKDLAEDINRHHALHKIIGRALMRDALPLSARVLLVSGIASFEILQKAFLAGIPIVATMSAPSTLAVDFAAESGVTLVGFVRDNRFNVYTHPERVIT
jgi:FdhD protein